jgi:hypothetical protein
MATAHRLPSRISRQKSALADRRQKFGPSRVQAVWKSDF